MGAVREAGITGSEQTNDQLQLVGFQTRILIYTNALRNEGARTLDDAFEAILESVCLEADQWSQRYLE
jgi:hypothetical protein